MSRGVQTAGLIRRCPVARRSGHCRQLAPKWRKVAEALHGVAKVAAVNCEQQQALCQQNGIRGYPTIKAFRCV